MKPVKGTINFIENNMKSNYTVLYVHGMGGGGDSRIPSILNEHISSFLPENISVRIVVRTYSFDPEISRGQLADWRDELQPELIIGESLGSLGAIALKGVPHLLVSPSLNAPLYFCDLAWLALIPGVTPLLDRIYHPREGDRQPLHFTYRTLRKYKELRRRALANAAAAGSTDHFHAFFGRHDHYRRSGIVSVRTWKKYFGESFTFYDGTHFMEEEYVLSLLIPEILNVLEINGKNK